MAKRKRDKQGGVICLAAHVIKELLIRNPVDLFLWKCDLQMWAGHDMCWCRSRNRDNDGKNIKRDEIDGNKKILPIIY